MGLHTYVLRRILLMIPTLFGVTLLIFAVIQLFTPVQRASLFVTDIRGITDIGDIMKKYHLTDPVYVQYVYWISAIGRGNLGWSETAHMPVLNAILAAMPATIELVMFSIPIIIIVGIKLGVISAVHRDKSIDHATRFFAIIGWSLPTFWLGIVLIALFFGGFGVFPPMRLDNVTENYVRSAEFTRYTGLNTIDGILNGQLWVTWEALQHLVLPTITLAVISVALIIRVMRSSMLEALNKGYITTARAKGLAQSEVINKHARRNALIPVITLSGLMAASMLNGVVITETVFNYKGLGYLAAHAALQVDIPTVLGFALFTGAIFVVANLIVDILYAYIDPRIRLA